MVRKILFLFLFLFSIIPTVMATHGAGGEIIYSLIPGQTNQYNFIFKFYRDCAGSPAPGQFQLCYSNQCNPNIQAVTMGLYVPIGALLPNGHLQGDAVSTGCMVGNNTCNGGNNPGIQEYWYSVNITLPIPCNKWRFWTTLCCRNGSIANIDNPGSQSFFVETTFDNTNNQNLNSSPFFAAAPIPYFCINIPVSYNNVALDPDGDSLTYEGIEPRHQNGCNAFTPVNILLPVYNIINNPFSTNNTFNINLNTGAITFTPNMTGMFVITIKVNEYRNGVLIGYVLRDIQFVIGMCMIMQPTFMLDTLNITGGNYNNNQINTCVGDSLYFCFQIHSSNPAADLHSFDNALIAIPGGTISYTGMGTNLISACSLWIPNLANIGLHTLIINAVDSDCVVQGQVADRIDTILIQVNNTNINPLISIVSSTNIAAIGTPITYTATTNVTPPYNIKWYLNNVLTITTNNTPIWNTTMQAGTNVVYAVIDNYSTCFSPDSSVSNSVTVLNSSTGIGNLNQTSVTIYPNPARTVLHIEGLYPGDIVKMYNLFGNTFFAQKVNSTSIKCAVADLPKGIYTVVTIRNHSYQRIKFEKN